LPSDEKATANVLLPCSFTTAQGARFPSAEPPRVQATAMMANAESQGIDLGKDTTNRKLIAFFLVRAELEAD
jgi:hypothetical protein